MTTYETWTLVLQGAVAIAVFATLLVYYHQLRVMADQLRTMQKTSLAQSSLALVEFLQSPEVREARRCVREDLSTRPLQEWSSTERQRAALVASNYDVAAALLKAGLAPLDLIAANWGPSIRHCHTVLTPFVQELRSKPGAHPTYWSNFDWLNEQVTNGSET